MKLAEALAERAEAQRQYEQLQQRILRVARVQEGDEPAEDPEELLTEANKVLDRLDLLIRRINKTNTETKFDEKYSLTDAIAFRDMALKRRKLYSDLATRASTSQDRYTRTEVRYVSTVKVKDMQARVDQLAKEYRELDTKIQRLNWEADLL
ncbi:uncharacterized protein MJAP1_003782 [Malassezia japonica]|uniref:Septicolysin n=1 Tax=Malassezia japonica TaxID=223818 RepID=A0AAF0F9D9_9BASI|nr:uncharacterized protein MJAP1_002370 [Malassezia japonica]XP_060123690.1 uncharacterized protein MJAP1_003782 [Malassezia japonica]WFD39393.1 hypothetical protein MJAP1_002370 [Malassezia japonica]WFD40793.1 hypothetical protein MJAP1_003782 [Malassezia japonica]